MASSMKAVSKSQQRGAALGVGLVLLLAMSLSGVFIMNSSIMDERMSSNHRNQTNAFLAAEAGLLRVKKALDANFSECESILADHANAVYDQAADTTFEVSGSCGSGTVDLTSTGKIDKLGVVRVLTATYSQGLQGGMPSDAPAAISCLGGGCVVTPGKGGSSIDGRDYRLPDDLDSNVKSYRRDEIRLTDSVMPSLFFSDRSSSSVERGGGNFEFCGSERTGCNADNQLELFFNEDSYPEVKGEPTHPTVDQFFGPDSPFGNLIGTDNGWGSRESPEISKITSNTKITGGLSGAGIMIIDKGAQVELGGNVRFEGLIVIRGCGSINMSGTPLVYGAVMVDASDCKQPYKPFGESGTPTMAYSLEALENANGLIPNGAGGGLSGWREYIDDGSENI